jgi:hypothetical protein
MDSLVLGSAVAYLCLCFFDARSDHHWRAFFMKAIAVLLLLGFWQWRFGVFNQSAAAKSDIDDGRQIAILYLAMLAGLLCKYVYSWTTASQPSPFSVRALLAPCFLSPIVFIPFYMAIKDSWNQSSTHWLTYFVAYENGFLFHGNFSLPTRRSTTPRRKSN